MYSLEQLSNFAAFIRTLATFFYCLLINLPKVINDCAIDGLDRALDNLLSRHLRVIKTILVINHPEIRLGTFVTDLRLLPLVDLGEEVNLWL